MAWAILIVAGLFETVWAVGLKFTQGFTRPWPTTIVIGALVISMALLERAVRDLPVGTAYAVWTGIGTVGTALVAMAFLKEPANAARLLGIGLIVAGIVVLKLVTPE